MSLSRRAFAAGLASLPLWNVSRDLTLDAQTVAAATASPAPPTPQVFDEHELATVAAMAELIIPTTDTPGGREAHVAEYLDLILSNSPETVRDVFLGGLWWVDGHSQRLEGAPFLALSPEDQGRIASGLFESEDPNEATGHTFLRSMKTWTAKIYYSTAIGQQELNKGGRVPAVYFGPCAG